MKQLIILILSLIATGCSMAGYGPAVDYSRFVSAKLAGDGPTAVFTAQRLVYRPATGWRAFPDGGIPYYVKDEDIIGIIGFDGRKARIIKKEKNRDWQDGQGQFFISHSNSKRAVITQSGQGRKDYLTQVRYFMLNIETSRLTPMNIKEDFKDRGREVGYFYLLDDRGTLLFINQPLGSAAKQGALDDLWLRYPDGEYLKVASGANYNGFTGRELIYWSLNESLLYSFNIDNRTTEIKPRNFYVPREKDKTLDVRYSSPGGKKLELWEKDAGQWRLKDTLTEIKDIN
jgi:hypothetical protein